MTPFLLAAALGVAKPRKPAMMIDEADICARFGALIRQQRESVH